MLSEKTGRRYIVLGVFLGILALAYCPHPLTFRPLDRNGRLLPRCENLVPYPVVIFILRREPRTTSRSRKLHTQPNLIGKPLGAEFDAEPPFHQWLATIEGYDYLRPQGFSVRTLLA